MCVSSSICFIVGMLIGSRHSVFALIPGVVLVSSTAGLAAAMQAAPWYIVFAALAGAAFALQLGYLSVLVAMVAIGRRQRPVPQQS